MGDVADILGLRPKREDTDLMGASQGKGRRLPRARPKPAGVSREVFNLLGDDGIAPMTQPARLQTGLKEKRAGATARWVWAAFSNPARSDNQEFYHWVKAGLENQVYPYAKYNTALEPIQYSDEEYDGFLQDDSWTRSETDHLMQLCAQFDLRWPVIVDRYTPTPPRTVEELQQRYYNVVAKLRSVRTGISDEQVKMEQFSTFDFAYERSRRQQQEILYRRTKDEEEEEEKLREELRTIDNSIKKLKKMIKQTAPAPKAESKVAVVVDQPQPGKPCLQSSRLQLADQTGLSKTLLKKLQALLRAFDVPEAPLATRTNCDLLDKLKKDSVALLSLHNVISKKEKELATLRQQLKITPDEVVLPLSALTTREQEVLAPEAAATSNPAPAVAAGAVPAPSVAATASATPPNAAAVPTPLAAVSAPLPAPAQQVAQAQPAQKRKVAGAAEVAQKGKRPRK